MGGAHGDVYAVFDYAPDTVLLTKSRGEDAEYNDEEDEEEEESEFQRWPTYSIAESPSRTDNGSAIESSDTDEGENPSVPPPRGRPIGLPKTNTIGTDSILSTSPSNHKRQLQGRQPRLHFDEDRRASASRNEGSADGSAQTEEDGMEGATALPCSAWDAQYFGEVFGTCSSKKTELERGYRESRGGTSGTKLGQGSWGGFEADGGETRENRRYA
jgi:hypothetical protein